MTDMRIISAVDDGLPTEVFEGRHLSAGRQPIIGWSAVLQKVVLLRQKQPLKRRDPVLTVVFGTGYQPKNVLDIF